MVAAVTTGEPVTTRRRLPPKWEYAQYSLLPRTMANWHSESQSIVELESYDMFTKMGGKCPKDKYGIVELLNLVGNRGWELIATPDFSDNSVVYIFKRPK